MENDFNKDNKEKSWLSWKVDLAQKIDDCIDKIKDTYENILNLPKRWYPIVFTSWVIWFALWCTLLIWIPWTTIIFIYWWVKSVEYIDDKLTPDIKLFLEKIKKILNINIS